MQRLIERGKRTPLPNNAGQPGPYKPDVRPNGAASTTNRAGIGGQR